MRPRASTLHSWPPPPAPGSVVPEEAKGRAAPISCPPPSSAPTSKKASGILALQRVMEAARRERATETVLSDEDVVEVAPPPPPPSSRRPVPARVVRAVASQIAPRASIVQAAGVCAAVLAGTLRARAVVVHAHDPRSGALRVIGADGAGTDGLVGTTCTADDDLVASTVVANEKLMKLRFDEGLPRSAPSRLHDIGAQRALLAVPVTTSRGCVAIIEVIDADEALDDVALDACKRAAEALLRSHAARS